MIYSVNSDFTKEYVQRIHIEAKYSSIDNALTKLNNDIKNINLTNRVSKTNNGPRIYAHILPVLKSIKKVIVDASENSYTKKHIELLDNMQYDLLGGIYKNLSIVDPMHHSYIEHQHAC